MTHDFVLNAVLAQDTTDLGALGLSRLLLKHDPDFPWMILVPQRANLVELSDLDGEAATSLMQEIRQVSQTFQDYLAQSSLGRPDKMNIAALGNQVRQLHVHIIARYSSDEAWPNPVWSLPTRQAAFAQKAQPNARPTQKLWSSELAAATKANFFARLAPT